MKTTFDHISGQTNLVARVAALAALVAAGALACSAPAQAPEGTTGSRESSLGGADTPAASAASGANRTTGASTTSGSNAPPETVASTRRADMPSKPASSAPPAPSSPGVYTAPSSCDDPSGSDDDSEDDDYTPPPASSPMCSGPIETSAAHWVGTPWGNHGGTLIAGPADSACTIDPAPACPPGMIDRGVFLGAYPCTGAYISPSCPNDPKRCYRQCDCAY